MILHLLQTRAVNLSDSICSKDGIDFSQIAHKQELENLTVEVELAFKMSENINIGKNFRIVERSVVRWYY